MFSYAHSAHLPLGFGPRRVQRVAAIGLATALTLIWTREPAVLASRPHDEPASRVFLPLGLEQFAGPFAPPVIAPPTAVPAATDTPEPTEEPTETPTRAPSPTPTKPVGPDWLVFFNGRRALAKLPPVAEDPVFSRGDALHAKYMVKNDYIGHTEDSRKPYYTAEGLEAAKNGDVAVHSLAGWKYEGPIDLWMSGPFHLIPLISPVMKTTGFGLYSEADGGFQSGAAMEWQRGRMDEVPASIKFPIRWPENGMTMPILSHDGTEAPSPLTSCPGYVAPVGAPIVLQLGSGEKPPGVTKTSLSTGGRELVHCWFDETNYKNSNSSYQQIGRGALKMASAVVILGKEPLKTNTEYSVTIVASGTTYQWSFRTTSEAPSPFPAPPTHSLQGWMSLLR